RLHRVPGSGLRGVAVVAGVGGGSVGGGARGAIAAIPGARLGRPPRRGGVDAGGVRGGLKPGFCPGNRGSCPIARQKPGFQGRNRVSRRDHFSPAGELSSNALNTHVSAVPAVPFPVVWSTASVPVLPRKLLNAITFFDELLITSSPSIPLPVTRLP